MLCPFMTLNDGTEIVRSSSIRNGNQEQVRVQIETPVENGFKSATCILRGIYGRTMAILKLKWQA
jgi:hypothetical protein